ncbi:hypothetical protein JW964_03215 [candidate division KSB1 bacterium]|nr:hypothetical protein [candidate division KSB1 bacterium]
MEDIIIPIGIFMVLAYIVKILSDNRLRRLLIDKGQVNESVKYLFMDREYKNVPSSLKWGMVLIGIGVAILIGQLVPRHMMEEVTFGGMFLLAGLGLVLYYFIANKLIEKSKNDNLSM